MRLKLVHNFHGTDHHDASKSRDQDDTDFVSSKEIIDINVPVTAEEDSGQDLVLSGEEEADEIDGTTAAEEPNE